MQRYDYLLSLLLFLLLFGCQENTNTLFEELPPRKTGIQFKNTLRESEAFNVLNYSYFYNGGGVAVGDLNNDGLPDIYFTGNLVASHLYLNQGNWKFKNIAAAAKVEAAGLWNTGVTMADVNQDGFLDIYVCRSAAADPNARRNLLFVNNGDLTFTEQAKDYGIDDPAYSTQASFFDYDRDGDLDLFLLNHSLPEYSNFQTSIGTYKQRSNPYFGDKLYQNNDGEFQDVTKSAGLITNVLGFGLGVTTADFNNDGWLDLYICNDFNEEDYLYLNQQDGTFQEALDQHIDHTSLFSMGADAADVNNDGHMDLFTLDMLPENNYRIKMTSGADNHDKYRLLLQQGFYNQTMRNMLHLNEGSANFKEVGQLAGIANTDWSWSALFADYDLDGWQDLFITNGYLRDYTNMDFLAYTVDLKMKSNQSGNSDFEINEILAQMPKIEVPNKMYKNLNGQAFESVAQEWGFSKPLLSNGAAYADLDLDGDLDLVVNNVNTTATIYKNKAIENELGHFLSLKLRNSQSTIGTKVAVFANGNTQFRTLMPTRGYQSAVEPTLHFGFAKTTTVLDSIRVQWPDGTLEFFNGQINQTITLEKGKGRIQPDTKTKPQSSYFTEKKLVSFTHQENNFNDYKIQGLLPKFYSREGPPMAAGDLNGDGTMDLVLGGAANQATQVFFTRLDGKLTAQNIPILIEDQHFEDVAIALADIDADQDLDLFIASGGNHLPRQSEGYISRIYLNNGRGVFQKGPNLEALSINVGTIAAGDIDQDNDIDFFIGGSYVPRNYPLVESSYTLVNQGNSQFEIIEVKNIADGPINHAQILDFDKDGKTELIITGEWSPLSIWVYSTDGNWQIKARTTEKGWWNTFHCANLDEDPALEIVAGNLGLNTQFVATNKMPLINYYEDFDQNGSVDPILTCYNEGVSYPFLPRDDILGQLVNLKKAFPNYKSYAETSTEDLLSLLGEGQTDTINHLKTTLYDWNNDRLNAIELPLEAQESSVHSMLSIDVDQDQDLDLILTGNDLYNRVKIGDINANHGLLLENKGNLKFVPVEQDQSGLNLRGAVRSSVIFTNPPFTFILFGLNDGQLKSYQLKNPLTQ